MGEFHSVSDLRRKAPFHFLARAENARDCARYLSAAPDRSVAFHEGFCREASVAIELIIKAMIAQNIEGRRYNAKRPPNSHDVLQMWSQAGLPKLTKGQQRTLLEFGRILKWAGRYPAPLKDEEYAEYAEREEALVEDPPIPGTLRIRRLEPLTWERLIDVFELAWHAFWDRRNADRPWDQSEAKNN